jgi:hypothetical protein
MLFLYVPMVPSSALAIAADGERVLCGGFFLGETGRFGSLEFIADCFGGLSLSPNGDGSDAAFMGLTRSGPPSRLRAMIGDSTEEFHMVSGGEGGSDLPSPKRHGARAPSTPATAIAWPEDTPTTQAITAIPPWPDTDLPFEQWHPHQGGGEDMSASEHSATLR